MESPVLCVKAHLNGTNSVKILYNCITIFQKMYLVYLNMTNSVKHFKRTNYEK